MIRSIRHICWLIICIPTLCMGQNEMPDYQRWSLGVSAGDILHQLFNAEEENRSYAAFVIEHRGRVYALQAGFRPGYNHTNTQHEGFVDMDISKRVALSGGLAMTRAILDDPVWMIRVGVKAEGGRSREDHIEDSGFDRITTRRLQWNMGAGPVIDFRCWIHPRLSLGTEASLIYSVGRSELQQLFTNFPDFNTSKDIVKDESLIVNEPATIYLRYHF